MTIVRHKSKFKRLPVGDLTQIQILRYEYNRAIAIAFGLEDKIRMNIQNYSCEEIIEIEIKAAAWRAIARIADGKIHAIVFG